MSPPDQFAFVQSFNWDDGFSPIREVLKKKDCALETALLAFWRAEGPWAYIEGTEDDAQREFVQWLAERILGGFYQPKLGGFDPKESEGVSAVQLLKLTKARLPTVFLGATPMASPVVKRTGFQSAAYLVRYACRDMKDEFFEINWNSIRASNNIARYCINRLYGARAFPVHVESLIKHGGIGGDIDWGIHKWDNWSFEDYGVPEFDGWRCYIGPEENGTKDVWDCYISEHEIKELLIEALNLFIMKNPKERATALMVIIQHLSA